MFCPYLPKDLVRRCPPLQTETEKNIKVLQHILKVMLLIDSRVHTLPNTGICHLTSCIAHKHQQMAPGMS